MGLLLYKSNEMYSSAELIRKSKMIFEQISEKKIGKAVILEEGRPCFLLMDFQRYEEIITEYQELKSYVNRLKERSRITKEPKKSVPEAVIKKEEIIPEPVKKVAVPVLEKPLNEPEIPSQQLPPKTTENAQLKGTEEPISEEQEIKNALESIANMNFDDDMKLEAELKIKTRILQARAERLKVLQDKKQQEEDAQEDLRLQDKLQESKMQKDRELREFWD